MKRYYKIIDGKNVFATNRIEFGNKQIINPTHEQYLASGWQEYIVPDLTAKELLQRAIQAKLIEIEIYDQSEAVNSFILNGEPVWLNAETRSNYRVSIEAAELLEETDITFQIGVIIATIPIADAKRMLAEIQRYADACFLWTQFHKKEISKQTNIQNINNYSFKSGYPIKLNYVL